MKTMMALATHRLGSVWGPEQTKPAATDLPDMLPHDGEVGGRDDDDGHGGYSSGSLEQTNGSERREETGLGLLGERGGTQGLLLYISSTVG